MATTKTHKNKDRSIHIKKEVVYISSFFDKGKRRRNVIKNNIGTAQWPACVLWGVMIQGVLWGVMIQGVLWGVMMVRLDAGPLCCDVWQWTCVLCDVTMDVCYNGAVCYDGAVCKELAVFYEVWFWTCVLQWSCLQWWSCAIRGVMTDLCVMSDLCIKTELCVMIEVWWQTCVLWVTCALRPNYVLW